MCTSCTCLVYQKHIFDSACVWHVLNWVGLQKRQFCSYIHCSNHSNWNRIKMLQGKKKEWFPKIKGAAAKQKEISISVFLAFPGCFHFAWVQKLVIFRENGARSKEERKITFFSERGMKHNLLRASLIEIGYGKGDRDTRKEKSLSCFFFIIGRAKDGDGRRIRIFAEFSCILNKTMSL